MHISPHTPRRMGPFLAQHTDWNAGLGQPRSSIINCKINAVSFLLKASSLGPLVRVQVLLNAYLINGFSRRDVFPWDFQIPFIYGKYYGNRFSYKNAYFLTYPMWD